MSLKPSTAPEKRRKLIYGLGASTLVFLIALGIFASNGWLPASVYTSVVESVPEIAIPVSAETETQPTPLVDATPITGRITAELVVMTPRGFEPSRIVRPSGNALFVFVNKTEFPSMNLRLVNESGTALKQMEMPRNRRKWSFPANLPVGRYRLVDANRPTFACDIEITR
ncbi:MAG: hypothetical protein IPG58_06720 [Acidobacteria bacterium]|nr:hypothetical protein [Acidobacteriota bacterium]